MKKLNYIFAVLLAFLCGTNVALADVVQNYTMDFNTSISTSTHDFQVAPGWGHLVDTWEDDDEDYGWGSETYYVNYYYNATMGRDNSGTLRAGSQTLGGYYSSGKVNDLIVTPKITGNSSVWVKLYQSSGSIKFFTVTKDGNTWKRGSEIEVTLPTLSSSDWTKVELPEMTEATNIGIRLDNAYMDDFAADNADITLNPGLKVTNANLQGNGDIDCDANGKFQMTFKFTVTNNGEVDLTPGYPNYSVSLVNYSKNNAVLYTMPIEEALAKGESKQMTLTCEADYATYPDRCRYDIVENITNTPAYGTWVTPIPYKPVLELRTSDSSIDANESFAYGMINEEKSKTFIIRNKGAAPLNITSITIPEGFQTDATVPFTVAAHETKDFTITLPATTAGIFGGNVTVSGDDVDPFSFAVSGTVLDASKFFCDFEDEKIPVGCIYEGDWSVKQRDYTSSENHHMLVNGSRDKESKFITPLLKVTEGEKMSFDVARTSYMLSAEDVYLKVYYSTNRSDWQLAKTIPSSELKSTRPNSSYYMGDLTTFILDNVPAGQYYIAFGGSYVSIDNIYGYEKVNVAHDMYVKSTDITSRGMVNYDYTATVTVNNNNSAIEAADSYTASLYFGDKVVATAEATEIASGANKQFSFTFTPHEAGDYNAHFEFKNAADNYTLTSESVAVSISPESASTESKVGMGTSTSKEAPINWYNADNTVGSNCDILYKPEYLQKYGIKAGSKITSVTFKGISASGKTLSNLKLAAYIGTADAETFEAGKDYENLTKVVYLDGAPFTCNDKEEIVTTFTLPEPITWDGTSALRVFTWICGGGSGQWATINYDLDSEEKTGYTSRSGSATYSNVSTPVTYFGIESLPPVVSGTVSSRGAAVEGATVTLTSGNVIYTANSDAEGKYSMQVFQNDKEYTLTAEAAGYKAYSEEEPMTFTADVEKNIELTRKTAMVTGKVTCGDAPIANAYVSIQNLEGDPIIKEDFTIEDGTFALYKVPVGLKYTLKVTAAGYNAFSEENFEVAGDMEKNIELTKSVATVSGKVLSDNEPVQNAKVTYSFDNGESQESAEAVTDADGKYELSGLTIGRDFTVTVSADNFDDLTETVSVTGDMTKDFNIVYGWVGVNGYVVFGNEFVPGASIEASYPDKKGETQTATVTADDEGTFSLTVWHNTKISVSVKAEGYEDKVQEIEVGAEGNEVVVSLEAKPINVTVGSTGYATFSYNRAVDMSLAKSDIKAYVVESVSGNYIVMKEITNIPAGTGVILAAAPGEHQLQPVAEEYLAPESNLLVGTYDGEYAVATADEGSVYTLVNLDGMAAFTPGQFGDIVPQNKAYLKYKSSEPVIYMSAASGINAINAASGNKLDPTKPAYNVAGQQIGKNYKGVVIQNGKTFVIK